MANRMIIDASHPEETRVVVLRGNRVEEFDFESASKRPLRGNIYLAKVTRVEPSLQAAFVDYGGNRHGFLAFSEIHPDYYQIPVADRQALLEEEARGHNEEDDEPRGERRSRRHRRPRRNRGAANGRRRRREGLRDRADADRDGDGAARAAGRHRERGGGDAEAPRADCAETESSRLVAAGSLSGSAGARSRGSEGGGRARNGARSPPSTTKRAERAGRVEAPNRAGADEPPRPTTDGRPTHDEATTTR